MALIRDDQQPAAAVDRTHSAVPPTPEQPGVNQTAAQPTLDPNGDFDEGFGDLFDDGLYGDLGIAVSGVGGCGESLAEFLKNMEDQCLSTLKDRAVIRLIQDVNLYISFVVLANVSKIKEGSVPCFVFMMEETIHGISATKVEEYRTIRGVEQIVRYNTTDQFFDPDARNIVARHMARDLGCELGAIKFVANATVKKSMDLRSPETAKHHFTNALSQLASKYVRRTGKGITYARLTDGVSQLVQTVYTTPGEASELDVEGQPCAADFRVTLALKEAGRNNRPTNNIHSQASEAGLTTTTVHVDLMRLPPSQVQPTGVPGMVQQPTPGHAACLTITSNHEALLGPRNATAGVPAQLLGMTSLAVLSLNNNWVAAYQNFPGQVSAKESIGMVAVEHDPYLRPGNDHFKPVNVMSAAPGETPGDAMTPEAVAAMWVHPASIHAIDCLRAGVNSWAMDIFQRAATDPAAQQRILSECDALFNGKFLPIWNRVTNNSGASPVLPQTSYILAGTYREENRLLDIRSLDYTKVVAMGLQDPQFIAEVTSGNMMGADASRVQKRMERLRPLIPSIEITGAYTRCYFHPALIGAMAEAMVAAEMVVITNANFNRIDTGRAYIDPNNLGVVSQGGAFQNNQGGQSNYAAPNSWMGHGY